MRHIDLFSGIGGFALACKWTWDDQYENVGHSEVEEYPCKVYHRHFPESECLGDITKIEWKEGQADLVTGGFPCQPFSYSGKRKQKEDERYLWPAMLEAIRKIGPRYVVGENVGGARSVVDEICSDLENLGYEARPVIIEAGAVGANIIRERIWFVASSPKTRNYKREKSYPEQKASGRTDLVRKSLGGDAITAEQYFESSVCRIAHGVPNRMDRLGSLGNAIVPQVARVILEAIKQHDESI